jgi:hypothetical protein
MSGWIAVYTRDGSAVFPVDDVIGHDETDCACLPTVEFVPDDDGPGGFMTVHHAWDGRK